MTRPLHLLHVTNYFMPELGYQEEYLVKYQARAGYSVSLVTSDFAYPPQSDYRGLSEVYPNRRLPVGTTVQDGVEVVRLPTWLDLNMQVVFRGLLRTIADRKPDVVVMHGLSRLATLQVAIWKGLRRKSFRLIVDDHTHFSAYQPKVYRRAYYATLRRLMPRLSRSVDAFIAIANETADFLAIHLGVDRESIQVVPLGIDTDMLRRTVEGRAQFRRALDIPENDFVTLYVGKLTHAKGIQEIYRGVRDLLRSDGRTHLVYVGSGASGADAAEVKKAASLDGVNGRVHWAPHVPRADLAGVYSSGDVGVWPKQETIGALEAASCGLPLVLPDTPIGRDYAGAGNGIVCGSVEELAEALATLHHEPERRTAMGSRGAVFVRESRSWHAMADAFTQICVGQPTKQGAL